MFDIIFYIISILLLISSCFVITVSRPVYATLLLIFAFFNAVILLLMIGAEYVAITLLIVYVGAIAVLFLSVVMMLDVERIKSQNKNPSLFVGVLLSTIALFEFLYVLNQDGIYNNVTIAMNSLPYNNMMTNTEAIGANLYTRYLIEFQASGAILLSAMIGAILLALHKKKSVKRQNITEQIMMTNRQNSVRLENPKIRDGITYIEECNK
ncbi:MAG: NADH-quinone oxidoreductase subunit J [Proteobacteria bacterium]|nr:NADH-quinone oxidoreductase subunit J [Pseudomonadota bacterium]